MAITVTPTVEPDNLPPRVRLDVAASAGETATTVTRLNPDGSTVPTRTSDGLALPLSAGVGLVYDYESPFGEPVEFSSLETPANVSSPVTVPASVPWLIHPGVPVLSLPLDLLPGSLAAEAYTSKQAVYYPMGRATPVVNTDGARKAASSELVHLAETLDELAAMQTLLADASPLLLNIPVGLGLGFGTCYISVTDVTVARLTDAVIDEFRKISMPFTVVDRPVGGNQAERTWVDVIANFATWADVMATYPQWIDVLTGP